METHVFNISNNNLPVTTSIQASRRSTHTASRHAREQMDANIDFSSMIGGQTNTSPLMDSAEASETTPAPRQSGQVKKVQAFFSPRLNYINYTCAGEPCSFEEAWCAPDAELWKTAMP